MRRGEGRQRVRLRWFGRHLLNGRNRRISPIAVRSGEGLLSDPIAGAQRGRRELLFMPQSRRVPKGELEGDLVVGGQFGDRRRSGRQSRFISRFLGGGTSCLGMTCKSVRRLAQAQNNERSDFRADWLSAY
jgi:hypothetical protein